METNKEELLLYLQEQKEQRLMQVNGYGYACEVLEAAKKAVEEAQANVEKFGNIADVHAEIAKIDGFINLLTEATIITCVPCVTVDTTVSDTTLANVVVC